MAEISVPAWPMPTQKTKLVMSKAQHTGRLRFHTPTPVKNRYRTIRPRMPSRQSEMAMATYQARGGAGGLGHAGTPPSVTACRLWPVSPVIRVARRRGSSSGVVDLVAWHPGMDVLDLSLTIFVVRSHSVRFVDSRFSLFASS